MTFIKKVLALFMASCLILGVTACNNDKSDKDDTSKDSSSSIPAGTNGGYTSNDESTYEDTVSDWQNSSSATNGSFDNTKETNVATPTPGTTGTIADTVTNTDKSDSKNDTATTLTGAEIYDPDFKRDYISEGKISKLVSEKDTLQYYYEADGYAYGILEDGKEIIAFRDEHGNLYDVINGMGLMNLKNETGASLLTAKSVKSFKVSFRDGFDVVIVTYNLSGKAASLSTVTSTYIFKENSIDFSCQVNSSSDDTFSTGTMDRIFQNSYIESDCRVVDEWIYPSNGDYPYPDLGGLLYETKIDKHLYMYTFRYENDMPTYFDNVEKSNPASLPCYFSESKGIYHTASYSMCFVDRQTEGTDNRYRGLFKSQNSDFAVGVSPVEATDDNSSVFIGNEVKLNLNVTNLTSEDLKFSIRYDVMNYYGEIVDSGIFIDSTAYAYVDANRTITVGGKYGMYYLNYYIISKYSTYIETYPFALLQEYDYKYNTTSPFGFATTSHGTDIVYDTHMNTCKFVLKVGMANARVGTTTSSERLEYLYENGVQMNGHYNPTNASASSVEKYVNNVVTSTSKIADYITSMEVGNEMSLQCLRAGGPSHEEIYPLFYHYTYKPTLKALKSLYPNLIYVPTPFSACEPQWIKQCTQGFTYTYTEDNTISEAGKAMIGTTLTGESIWSEIEVVCTHIYGHPWMPDSYGTYQVSEGGGMWHIEPGMQRMANCIKQFSQYRNGKDDPEFYITELGQPTITGDADGNDLRTQGDYIARMGIIAAAYGADRIQYYCLYDRTSVFSGYNHTDMEWNYGLCYEPDLFGRIKPKPAIVTYANMTRQLESVKKNSSYHSAKISTEYDEGYANDGVRAFEFDTHLHGKVVVAWSNQQVLPNGKKNAAGTTGERIPTLPWNTLWTEVDETEFNAAGDTVTVYDSMGNATTYKAENGKVTIPLTGEVCYIHGLK